MLVLNGFLGRLFPEEDFRLVWRTSHPAHRWDSPFLVSGVQTLSLRCGFLAGLGVGMINAKAISSADIMEDTDRRCWVFMDQQKLSGHRFLTLVVGRLLSQDGCSDLLDLQCGVFSIDRFMHSCPTYGKKEKKQKGKRETETTRL